MSESSSRAGGAGQRRERGGDLVIPVLAVAFTVYYFVSIQDAPWTAKVSTYFIGSVLIGLVVIAVIGIVRELLAGSADLDFTKLLAPGHLLLRRLLLLALTIGYVVVIEWGGFTLTTAVYLYAAMLLLGGPRIRRRAFWVSMAYALGGYLLFIAAFETRFPAGPFETLVKGLL